MKKTLLLILALLPIVLIVVISVAGRMLSYYQHIPVERVEFITEAGDPFGENDFILNQGDTKSCAIRIYPELASDKDVTYTSSNEAVCTVDKNGNITGVHYGSATVTVKTDDGNKIAMLNVRVTADYPVGVIIVDKDSNDLEDLTLLIDEQYSLKIIVETTAALDKYKKVTYTSSNPAVVSVDVTGKITALAEGTATITVTTEYGSYTDTLLVTVEPGQLPLAFDFSGAPDVTQYGDVYAIDNGSINLLNYLLIREDINPADVHLEITSGSTDAALENGVLTIHKANVITVRAYVGNADAPEYFVEVNIGYIPQ